MACPVLKGVGTAKKVRIKFANMLHAIRHGFTFSSSRMKTVIQDTLLRISRLHLNYN
ncbi:hypothetical protein COLO4_04552 [Corchorus olitorius]|uniref:Uncharacterized protein n=1 Tax=Corchorus olitorius TaxID=93759 RepID=A0A1R3KTI2_9ROSI|nr:hypothetical protein COLO4_04552 [Corchorus olitorius]